MSSNRLLRAIGIGILGIFLMMTLVSANIVVGADRTVLDGEFVKDTLEEEGFYATLSDQLVDSIEEDALSAEESSDGAPLDGVNLGAIVENVFTEEYLKAQIERNIDNVYAYLHGDRDDLELSIDTEPVKDELVAEVSAELIDGGLDALDADAFDMADSEAEFEANRDDFKNAQLQRIQAETDDHLSEAELEAHYDANRDAIRAELIDNVVSETDQDDVPAEAQDGLRAVAEVQADALVDNDMTYDEYLAAMDDAQLVLADGMTEAFRAELDEELPDRMDLTEDMDEESMGTFESMRSIVSLIGILVYVLPLVALALAGGIGFVTATRSGALFTVGSITTVAGLAGVATMGGLASALAGDLEADGQAQEGALDFAAVVLEIMSQTVSVFISQSWVLVGLGVVLLVGGVAIRQELLPIPNRPGDDVTTESAAENTENDDSSDGN